MRIAVNAWFIDIATPGSGQYLQRLVSGLGAKEPEIESLLVIPHGKAPDDLTPGEQARIHVARTPFRATSNLGKVWFEQIAFPRACIDLATDVALVPYWAPPLHPTIPTAVTIHDIIPRLLPAYRGSAMVRLYTALVSRAARAADLIITDSRASRRDIVTHLGLPAERVRTIYLAAGDAYTPQPSTQDRMIRKQYEVPETYVLYLGGFDVRKNVETIIQAYGRAREAHSSFCPLVIAGRLPAQDTPFTPDPRRLAHEADLPEESILFPGYIEEDDKPALYRGAVVFLFPSLYEGFGLPPLEAMACGVPVVASNAGSLPEIVGDGGALFAAGDQQSIASELAKLIHSPTYRGQRSQQAVRTASRFSWDQTIEETTAALRSISMES